MTATYSHCLDRYGKSLRQSMEKRSCSPTDASRSVPQYAEVGRKISQPKDWESEAHVKAALYADDLALICSEDSCGTAQVRLQECLTLLEQGTEDWAMTVKAAKTIYSCCIFSLSTKIPNLRLKINNTLLQRENHP